VLTGNVSYRPDGCTHTVTSSNGICFCHRRRRNPQILNPGASAVGVRKRLCAPLKRYPMKIAATRPEPELE
jgi:hypothetical protein